MWLYNWAWISDSTVAEGVDTACMRAREYIMEHAALMRRRGKPLVVEEFGYPRDAMAIEAGSPTTGRDRFYEYVFALLGDSAGIAGCNFWGWGGYAEPAHRTHGSPATTIPAIRLVKPRGLTPCLLLPIHRQWR